MPETKIGLSNPAGMFEQQRSDPDPTRDASGHGPRFYRLCLAWLFASILFIAGCDGGGSLPTVDFSKKLDPQQLPASREPPPRILRVAIAAIISPEETLGHYHDLLKYIGRRLNHDIFLQLNAKEESNGLDAEFAR